LYLSQCKRTIGTGSKKKICESFQLYPCIARILYYNPDKAHRQGHDFFRKSIQYLNAKYTMRAFIALEIPKRIKSTLEDFLVELRARPGAEKVRWVTPRNMHLTLKFLGEIEPDSVSQIEGGLRAAGEGQSPIQLELSQIGCFPSAGKPRVLWIGIGGEIEVLLRLQARVDKALEASGFAGENRAYHPHLTLGRVRRGVSKSDLDQVAALVSIAAPESPAFIADEVVLFESVLRPEGPVYQAQSRVQLGGGA
jgi:2'-5' RNA ligase